MIGTGTAPADDRNWRRNDASRAAPQSIPFRSSQHLDTDSRGQHDQDSWRVQSPLNVAKNRAVTLASSPKDGEASVSSPNAGFWSLKHQRHKSGQNGQLSNSHNPFPHSFNMTTEGESGHLAHTSSSQLAVKPSSMGNGVIGRTMESTSPIPGRSLPPARGQWPLSSSLEKSPGLAPATLLPPLRIEHKEGSRFFPAHSTPSRTSLTSTGRPITRTLESAHNLPVRFDQRHERSTNASMQGSFVPDDVSLQAPAPVRHLSEQPVNGAQHAVHSSHLGLARHDIASNAAPATRSSTFNLHASPKRSPMLHLAQNTRAVASNGLPSALLRSSTTSPAVGQQRTLSPASRQSPFLTDSQPVERAASTISSLFSGPYARPGQQSRRESFGSATSGVSVAASHNLSRSRRSSAILSPHSPGPNGRSGVYRPPHLRNRGSFSGLKPSVAHYDRVRTPSLRGVSRSRESSISLSRPPSTIPFSTAYDAAMDEGQPRDDDILPPRGRPGSFSSHLPNVIAEQQQRSVSIAGDDTTGDHHSSTINQHHDAPQDSATKLANLRAELVRREAAATELITPDMDRNGTIFENEEPAPDAFDMSDMIEYGMAEGYPISRHSSMYPGSERLLKEVFEIGDLLGPGIEHDGHLINIAETTPGFVEQNADLTGSKLEVIRKLGEGSYAVVYLVKEVDADTVSATPAEKLLSTDYINRSMSLEGTEEDSDLTMIGQSPSEDLLSSTLKAKLSNGDNSFHSSPALERRRRKDLRVKTHLTPGREFALKCLCKRDLPEDMLEVQRLEATIHQSIPAHPNIVTLYRTYETPDWLFLVLEYCPGQDLYYWLEQAQDSGSAAYHSDEAGLGDDDSLPRTPTTPATRSDNGNKLDATPPSPSILASTSNNTLLSKRRIRLIARMFRQICDAVQFCHDRGISHRDIKPENFIVEDLRTFDEMLSANGDMSSSTLLGSSRDGEDAQVIVKMTDFGLATAAEQCDDFDCGSKPYMAFECHNNVSSSYDPKQADIWSLGIVLLNMLFHRSPFTQPSLACPSFTAYCHDPVRFLMESFDGLSEKVALFLRDHVFCEVSNEQGVAHKRISAGDFSNWASNLVEHMGLGRSGPRVSRGGSIYSTMPLMHSRNASMSTLPSMLNSPSSRSRSMTLDPVDADNNPDATYRGSSAPPRALSPSYALYSPDVLPSPTFTPLPGAGERNPFEVPYTPSNLGAASRIREEIEQVQDRSEPFTDSSPADNANSADESQNDSTSRQAVNADLASESAHVKDAVGDSDADDVGQISVDNEEPEGETDKPESISVSNHSKRRKRGARKGRTLAKQLKRSQSVENMGDANSNDPVARAKERERTIRELALASQSLARQMSRIAKPIDGPNNNTASLPIVLSKLTAEAAARYNLQNLAQDMDGVKGDRSQQDMVHDAVPSRVQPGAESSASPVANWTSAAQRRERMIEHRKGEGATAQEDPSRGQPVSWRDRNQSTSSFASSSYTISSQSSGTSATSSMFSTTSAPAALTRKDYSRRNGTRTSGFGLDTISERERTTGKRDVDAQYLAGIFGGGALPKQQDRKKKEVASAGSSVPPGTSNAHSSVDKTDRARLFTLLSDSKDKSSSTTLLSTQTADAASQDQRVASSATQSGVRAVSTSSVASNSSSNSGTGSTFVSRFRRPGSSSSASTKSAAAGVSEGPIHPVTSTTYSTETREPITLSMASSTTNTDTPTSTNASGTTSAGGKKQRGMGKFLLGVRDSMKNF